MTRIEDIEARHRGMIVSSHRCGDVCDGWYLLERVRELEAALEEVHSTPPQP